MSNELAKFRERVRQNSTARAADSAAASVPVPSSAIVGGAAFLPGDRVFDTVTGIEGEVVSGARENLVIPTAKK